MFQLPYIHTTDQWNITVNQGGLHSYELVPFTIESAAPAPVVSSIESDSEYNFRIASIAIRRTNLMEGCRVDLIYPEGWVIPNISSVIFSNSTFVNSTGLGDYTESGQVIPVEYEGKKGLFVLSMYLDNGPAVLAGREIWGFPKKYAYPSLKVDPISKDALVGRLFYGELEVARGTMGYKWNAISTQETERSLTETPNYLIKLIPDVDGSPKIRQLVRYHLAEVTVKGAWSGPADLQLFRHALAPVADLPVRKVVSGIHFLCDLTLMSGTVEDEY